jgi:hypothetical protein
LMVPAPEHFVRALEVMELERAVTVEKQVA